MPEKISMPEQVKRGKQMPKGKAWRLIAPGKRTGFKATLITKFKVGTEKVAIFRVVEGKPADDE